MRILHVVHQYPPQHVGGVEVYTQAVARYQAAAGHDVSIRALSHHKKEDDGAIVESALMLQGAARAQTGE